MSTNTYPVCERTYFKSDPLFWGIFIAVLIFLTSSGIINASSTTHSARMTAIAAGEETSFALSSSGHLYSWGYNWNGQLGDSYDGWGNIKPRPGLILSNIRAISAGEGHTLALDNTGKLFVFGSTWDGQLGLGSSGIDTHLAKPTAVMTHVLSMAAGSGHSLVITSDHALYAFGRNRQGQLGTGDRVSLTRPLRVITGDVYAVAAGDRHSLAVLGDGSLLAWGENTFGQLGTGDTKDQLSPKRVLSDVYHIYAGRETSFAIRSDQSLWGWGKGIGSLLGQNNVENELQLTPVKIMDNVAEVAIGASHLLVLKTDHTLWCAGDNWLGQLGIQNSYRKINQLTQLSSGITAIAAGGWHSLALDSNGNVLTWGDNSFGQLGNLTIDNVVVPTRITVANPEPRVLFNHSIKGWSHIQPTLAVDRVVLPLEDTFAVLEVPHTLHQGKLLEFDYQDKHYVHLVGSTIFYVDDKRVELPLSTQHYRNKPVFLAFNTVELFRFSVHWDASAQLLLLEDGNE